MRIGELEGRSGYRPRASAFTRSQGVFLRPNSGRQWLPVDYPDAAVETLGLIRHAGSRLLLGRNKGSV